MIKYFKMTAVILLFAVAAGFQGCKGAGGDKFGDAPPPGARITAIGSIMSDPKVYIGKEVVVDGKITTQCPSGCFFVMSDNTGTIYVELKQASFCPLRQCGGSGVTVKGIVHQSSGQSRELQILANGLRIKS